MKGVGEDQEMNTQNATNMNMGTSYMDMMNNNTNYIPDLFALTSLPQTQVRTPPMYSGGASNYGYGNIGFMRSPKNVLNNTNNSYREGRGTPNATPPPPPLLSTTGIKRQKPFHVKRACMACKKAHAGCNQERPCSRCVKKGIPCVEQPDLPKKRKRRRKKVSGVASDNYSGSDSSLYEGPPSKILRGGSSSSSNNKDTFLLNAIRMKLHKLENDTDDLKKMMTLLLKNMGVPLPMQSAMEPKVAAGLDMDEPSTIALMQHASSTMLSGVADNSNEDDAEEEEEDDDLPPSDHEKKASSSIISPHIGPWSEWAMDFNVGIAVFSRKSNMLLTCNHAFASHQGKPQSELVGLNADHFETPPELESLLDESETRTVSFQGTNPTKVVIDKDVWWLRVDYA